MRCWLQVRKYLHVVLCFSPVGDKFRIRARQFPALVNCTSFDWFHTWPSEALVSVAARFLVDIPALQVRVAPLALPSEVRLVSDQTQCQLISAVSTSV